MKWIALVLADTVKLVQLPSLAPPVITCRDVVLHNVSLAYSDGYMTGFYDWLRLGDRVIGMRYAPFEDLGEIRVLSECRDFLAWEEGGLSIYFGAERTYDQSASADQLFGNAIYRSSSGDVAITVQLDRDEYGFVDSLHPC